MSWLSDWSKRIELTISGSLIEDDLTDFPVMIHLASGVGLNTADVSAVFDELGANSKKIAVTTVSGSSESQCYVEIERWDDANEEAWLWVKVPSISSSANTVLYLYYDSTRDDNTDYVGDTGDTPAQSVWDSNFVAVYHCAQDPSGGSGCVKDSTANGNNATPQGSMVAGDLVDAKVGKGYDLDGSDDYIQLPGSVSCKGDAKGSIECIAYVRATPGSNAALIYESTNESGYTRQGLFWYTDDKVGFNVRDSETGSAFSAKTASAVSKNAWHYFGGMNDSDADEQYLRVDEAQEAANTDARGSYTNTDPANDIAVGEFTHTPNPNLNMIVDEVRISDTARSSGWVKATYYTLFDSFFNFGAEENFWANSITLTIDHAKVNSDLTDFPVMIHLSDSTGINSYDASAVFDELAFSSNDDFTGSDGDSYDTRRWSAISEQGTIQISGNKLYINAGASQVNNLESEFTLSLSTDIDVQIDFSDLNFVSGTSRNAGFQLYINGDNYGHIYVYNDGSQGYYGTIKNGGGTTNLSNPIVTHTSGKFRITRTGTTLECFYWNGSAWASIGSANTNSWPSEPHVRFWCSTYDGSSSMNIKYDNFTVTDGDITWDDGFPNRKKIAITTEDFTECYVEIEDWDYTNEEAWLHTKVPTVSSGTDTVLYLYYDPTQSDNTTYVGDIGDTPAQSVWDSNFVFVAHMAQDPSGGADAVKDSTSHGTDGTSTGTTSLVDGTEAGKAIDFDGSQDYITFEDDDDSLNVTTALSVEAFVNRDSHNANGDAMVIKVDGIEDNYGDYYLNGSATDGTVYFAINNNNKYVGKAGVLSNGVWTYFAGTYDKTNIKLYVNDGSPTLDAHSADINTNETKMLVGSYWSTNPASFDGKISEVRVSSSARTAGWVKATYYTLCDDFITFSGLGPTTSGVYYFAGTVYEGVSTISGATVYMYRRDTGAYLGSTTSSGDGGFYVETTFSGSHFLVCLDPAGGETYNDLIYGQVTPASKQVSI